MTLPALDLATELDGELTCNLAVRTVQWMNEKKLGMDFNTRPSGAAICMCYLVTVTTYHNDLSKDYEWYVNRYFGTVYRLCT